MTRPSPRSPRMRWQPALRTLPPYHDDPLYIDALKADLERQLAALDFTPERLLLSFHGMPQRTLELGDPYHCHCRKTARLLGEALAIASRRRLPVALRAGQMARAGDRRGARGLSGAGRQAASPSPRRAFPPTASRRSRSSASAGATTFLARRRNAFRAARLPQRQRRGDGDARRADPRANLQDGGPRPKPPA